MQPLDAEDPRALGQYRLLRRIGSGGMGRVYLARSDSGRTVAVKVVHPHFAVDEVFRERFRREVASAQRVGGQWTAPVLDADPDAPVPWAATGYVAGPSLQDAVAEHGPLPVATVRAVGAGLAEALRHVHGLGLIHRDVKPSNVLLTLDGPLLIDFGIARATDSTASLTSSGVSIGSPGYMSPEQVLGQGATAASDVFSLGAVLALAATGHPPFPGDNSASLLYKVVHEPPEILPIPVDGEDASEAEGLRELITGCLAKDPAERPSPEEAARALTGGAGDAADLVGSGWLPAPIVEQVSRRAVDLLSLEPEGGPAAANTPAEPGGPAVSGGGFAGGGPSGGGTSGGAGAPPGVFGPPLSQTAPHDTGGGAHPSGAGEPGGGGASVAGWGSGGTGFGSSSGFGGGPGGPAQVSGSAVPTGAGGERPGDRSGRSRWLWPVAAGVVAAVLAGALLVSQLGSDDGGNGAQSGGSSTGGGGAGGNSGATGGSGGDEASNGDGGADGGSAEGSDGGGGGPEVDEIPKEFLGSWSGEIVTRSKITRATLRVTVRKGGKGDRALTITSVPDGANGLECSGRATVRKITANRLTVLEEGVKDSPTMLGLPVCSDKSSPSTLTREGSKLRYESRSSEAGQPHGTLSRTGS
ncbi:serine/threonine protein kinase [Streptomyces sp. AJS327]|uniref:serine/threonine-protein kinase n=1 Tax=Streptomyces sp. AJS327 TaxID=2545265 RepID=UPI0015E02220|nr:serine/threonine-protein kinase [Streptomyces sp. AJS327]MBA0053991.1 serine/threonine protein kinase [Streptomyces sp. AJS327]